MVIAFFTLHDPMDGARRVVLTIVVEATSKLSLFALAAALVDVAVGVTSALVLVEVGVYVSTWCGVRLGWLTSSWIVGSLLCAGRLDRLRECRLDIDVADLDTALLSSTRAVATRT
jgi:hypothetical protein